MPRIAAMFAAVALAASSGCAVLAAGFSADNHLGGCMDEAGPGSIDLVLGGLAAVALSASGKLDDSMGYLAIPGVFVASGVTSLIFVDRCRSGHSPGPSAEDYAIANRPSPPPEPALQPDQRDATPAELGLVPPAPTTMRSRPRVVEPAARLRLSPAYVLPDPPKPATIACSVEPAVDCPDHMYCQLDDEHGGHCVATP